MAVKHFTSGLLSILVLVLMQFINDGQAITLEISPETYTGDGGNTVRMSCVLGIKERAAKEVLLIKIAKKSGLAIALLHPGNRLSYGTADNRIMAEGSIETSISLSFLNVTLRDPEVGDSGQYTCVIDYVDYDGQLVENKASGYLSVNDPKLKEMKNTFVKLVERLDKQEQQLKTLEGKKMLEVNLKLTELSQQVNQHKQDINVLKKGDKQVAFSVNNENSLLWMKSGQVVVFPSIIMQIGDGYDKDTGVFTAPDDGLYVFGLSIHVACAKCIVTINLQKNDEIIDSVKSGDMDQAEQTSTTTVALLNAGDTIKAVVKEASIASFLINGKYCLFTGYRIGS